MDKELFTSPTARQSTKDFLKKEKWPKEKYSTCCKVVSAGSKVLSVMGNGIQESTRRARLSMKAFLKARR